MSADSAPAFDREAVIEQAVHAYWSNVEKGTSPRDQMSTVLPVIVAAVTDDIRAQICGAVEAIEKAAIERPFWASKLEAKAEGLEYVLSMLDALDAAAGREPGQ